MFDYSYEIDSFLNEKVKLSDSFKDKLYAHRKANRDRLIARLPEKIENLSISNSSFKPQGSMAMRTIIQTKFDDDEYDIDDGLLLKKNELVNNNGEELNTEEIRNIVLETLKDERFVKQPKFCTNCIRVFYKEDTEEKHHVDFPIYRISKNSNDEEIQELANNENWIESNPTQINAWFSEIIEERNDEEQGKGSQLRELIQLLKRFSKSRKDWDLPNGLKLTMLATECQDEYYERIDLAFKELLNNMKIRLNDSKIIRNLAHPDQPELTRTLSDENVENLLEKISLAIEKLDELDNSNCEETTAEKSWEWIFKSEGYFKSLSKNTSNRFANHKPIQTVNLNGGGRYGKEPL